MKSNLLRIKLHVLLIALLLLSFHISLQGQEVLTGLKQNSLLIKKYSATLEKSGNPDEAITLPIIEDFSTYIGYPNPDLFVDKQGFVNNSYPLLPPTIGVVTLDALDANGQIYAHATRDAFGADTLTSRPIRMDSLFSPVKRVLRIQDSIYFSFYYQPGGGTIPHGNQFFEWERVGDEPEPQDSLILEFGYETGDTIFMGFVYGDYIADTNYSPGDTIVNPFIEGSFYVAETFIDSGMVIAMPTDSIFGPEAVWNHIWSTPGVSLDEWLREDSLRYFKQVLIPIRDYQYLRNNFQFRFRNYASLEDNGIVGWASNVDQWHIDYIRLDINRTETDSFPNDVAFVMPSRSILATYLSMPWSQFQPQELADAFDNKMSNLSNSIKNTNYTYSIFKNDNQLIHTYTSNNENADPYYPHGLHLYAGHATPPMNFSLPTDSEDSATFKVVHIFQEEGSGDSRKQNDTVVFKQQFYNYYAYDDGVAESGYSILSNLTNPDISLAVRFTLNHPDTLRCVRMWFNHVLNDANEAPFTLTIWGDNNHEPGDILYAQPAQLPAQEEEFLDFVTYYLDEPIAISGTFYVGYMQTHNIQLNIGFDQNNDGRSHFLYKTANNWKEPFLKGVPMIRPAVGKYFTPHNVAIKEVEIKSDFIVYPNPTRGNFYLQIDEALLQEQNTMQLFDMYGKLLTTKPIYTTETIINMENFASGIYLLRLQNKKGIVGNKKIIKK